MKSYVIIPVIILLVGLGAVTGYYYMGMNQGQPTEPVELEEDPISEEELERIIGVDTTYLTEAVTPSVRIATLYDEHRRQMGPFTDYRTPGPEFVSAPRQTTEAPENAGGPPSPVPVEAVEPTPVRPPFVLSGIVGNRNTRLAVIDSSRDTYISREKDRIDGYTIERIEQDRIFLSRENRIHELVIGSDTFENN